MPLQLGADSAGTMTRPDPATEAAEWPKNLPGLWKGTMVQVEDDAVVKGEGGVTSEFPLYVVISQGYAANAWVTIDPKIPHKITTVTISKKKLGGGAPDDDESSSFFYNEPFKYTLAGIPRCRFRWTRSFRKTAWFQPFLNL